MQKIVITGSSGMVGRRLVPLLHTAGYQVVRALRPRSSASAGRDRPGSLGNRKEGGGNGADLDGVSSISWDPTAPPAESAPGFEGAFAVIHLAGENLASSLRWSEEHKRRLRESRVAGTAHLATLVAGLKQPPKALVMASAVGFYGDRGDETLTEHSPVGKGFLAELARDWEAAAEPARSAGVRVAQARFGVILAPGEGLLAKISPLFRAGLGGRLGAGTQWMSWVSLRDAARALQFLLEDPRGEGAFNVVGCEQVTNADFTRALAQAVGKPAFLPVPAFALKAALGEMARELLLASQRSNPEGLQQLGFQFNDPCLADALRFC